MRDNKKAAKHRFAPRGEDTPTLGSILKSACYALFITAGIGALLLLLCTALLLLTKNPGAYTGTVGKAVLYLTALLMGAIATGLHKGRLPLFCGITAGGVFLLVLLLTAIFLPKTEEYKRALQIGLYAAVPFFTTAGALLAARKPRAVKRRRRAF